MQAAESKQLTAGSEAPGAPQHGPGLPQMNPDSFPSQLFWLAITFGLLYALLARIVIPRIAGALADRHNRIAGDLDAADRSRKGASEALQAYQAALTEARRRALVVAEENRRQVNGEIDRLRAEAELKSRAAIAEAEKRIGEARTRSKAHIRGAASEAAAAIVERLTGAKVSAEEAAKAIAAARAEGA